METKETTFLTFDYKEVETEAEQVSFLIDAYGSFGWKLDENLLGQDYESQYAKRIVKGGDVKLYFKRDRKIINKAELTRLQRNFEACREEIKELEQSKSSGASACALTVGIIGTAFMAGSVFAVTASPPQILLCILLAVPAFVGWIMPYFLYKKMKADRVKKIVPMIEAKYEEMYVLCEKGSKLCFEY
ncbi:MAG: hypothetical protein E7253_08125 [Lachnospiraceae bacterium]|nr:hypothetical protein [Lachnospiraceae bacterium]